ncbi:MAG: peptidyl-prolyl cis-trans isomerase, partial [Helicobacter sp.]|nr:peptidyl-prolyl cis-trans isomerase [Helicobacter sp.]
RKGENQNTKTSIIYEGDGQYSQEFMNLLSQAKEKETLKPFKNNDSYVSVQILRIIPSQPKTYETAKKDARKDYIEFEKTKLLEEKAQKESANFKGVNVGYLGKGTTKKLEGLTPIEQQNFINQLFNTKEDSGYILLENKAVLYKILNQRVKKSDIISQDLDFLIQNGTQIKGRLIEAELLEYLSKIYKIIKNPKE